MSNVKLVGYLFSDQITDTDRVGISLEFDKIKERLDFKEVKFKENSDLSEFDLLLCFSEVIF